MAQGNDVVCSQSFTEETTNTQRLRLVAGTLTCSSPELPTLPFDLLFEILCRLPVKLLIQLRCLCKFFNSLISDPKFAKKHFHMSIKRRLMVTYKNNLDETVLHDSPISSLFSTPTVVTQTQLYPPITDLNAHGHHYVDVECSCDGMFCGELNFGSYFLWNPSIRKFKLLPPLESDKCSTSLSFGYDHFIDNYKVIVVSFKNEVFVNTLGTDYWTRIEDIPYSDPIYEHGVFVSGTVNWFIIDDDSNIHFILSLDLEKESYQELLLPDFENESDSLTLSVLRDCLCVFATSDMFLDVWIIKEYGNEESWTKLYSVPNMQDRGLAPYTVSYISEDDQLLVGFVDMRSRNRNKKLAVYDSKTDTLNIPEFENNYEPMYSNVYIESLISP